MTKAEAAAIHGGNGQAQRYWALLQDAGYGGAVANIPYPRIVLERPGKQLSPNGNAIQMYYKRRRVIVEQFFGRMKKVFMMSDKPYILEAAHQQMDIENIVMLTNEHIATNDLADEDGVYYRKWLAFVKHKEAVYKQARQESNARWRRRVSVLIAGNGPAEALPPAQRARVNEGDDALAPLVAAAAAEAAHDKAAPRASGPFDQYGEAEAMAPLAIPDESPAVSAPQPH
jgi:hypothetical protein